MDRLIHIAPMMGWTDRHGRFLMRLLSGRVWLWTEMVVDRALIFGDRKRFCPRRSSGSDNRTILQLGGCDGRYLAHAARIGEEAGFREINLNMGCPSRRVGRGGFGAAMMADLDGASRAAEQMVKAVSVPVSVKCRTGIDEQCSQEVLPRLLTRFSRIGVRSVTIHARKAWLSGLSPRQNRMLPPLNYSLVYEMKERFPFMELIVNGGVENLDEVEQHLERVDGGRMDGVMIGRAAFRDPFMLRDVDERFFDEPPSVESRQTILEAMLDYALRERLSPHHFTRLVSGLWRGRRGATHFRRALNDIRHLDCSSAEALLFLTQRLDEGATDSLAA